MSIKKKIILIATALIVIAGIVFIFVAMGTHDLNSTKTNDKSEEATLINTNGKTIDEWGEIPATDQLVLLASNQNGGSVGRIAYVNNPLKIIYSKVEIFGDYSTVYVFFKYDKQWAGVDEADVPNEIAIELNNKLNSPQKR